MFPNNEEAMLVQDQEDMIGILRMRFGTVPEDVIQSIYNTNDSDALEKLMLIAAEAQGLDSFLEKMQEELDRFHFAGDYFNPIVNLANDEGSNRNNK